MSQETPAPFEPGETVFATINPLGDFKGAVLEHRGDRFNIWCQFEGVDGPTLINKEWITREAPPAYLRAQLTGVTAERDALDARVEALEAVAAAVKAMPSPGKIAAIFLEGSDIRESLEGLQLALDALEGK